MSSGNSALQERGRQARHRDGQYYACKPVARYHAHIPINMMPLRFDFWAAAVHGDGVAKDVHVKSLRSHHLTGLSSAESALSESWVHAEDSSSCSPAEAAH